MDRSDVALALALFVGIALTAQVVNLLAAAGLEYLQYAAWILGYGGVVLTAWAVWIRPLDIHAPGRDDETVWDADDREPSESER